ncbi:MAG: hypothetical protein ABJM29_11875 [Rhizobiaceae bacterium]
MTKVKIEEFERRAELLNSAIQSSDDAKINHFKNEVEDVWNQLLLAQPSSTENSYELIEFFLERLKSASSSDMLNDQCKWKILALARSLCENSDVEESGSRRRL